MQLQIDFGNVVFCCFQKPFFYASSMPIFMLNIKMNIDLSATCIGAPGCNPFFPKTYPIRHIQKPMTFYHFAVLRENTIVLKPYLMLLKLFFRFAQKNHPFKHAVCCCPSINNAIGQHFGRYSTSPYS